MNRLVFTAYNRPTYFTRVMQTWAGVRDFTAWQPTVHLEPGADQDTMRAIAEAAGAVVHLNTHRRGVLTNPWHAVDTAFTAGATFVVLAEDDVLVSDDVLEYFTWAAATLADQHVLAVRACSMKPTCHPDEDHVVDIGPTFNPLVWGTWADRWTTVLRDTWDHDYSSGTAEHPQSGWDWNIVLRVKADWQFAGPRASRSTHIGKYGGAHMLPKDFAASEAPTFRPHRDPAPFHIEENQ